MGYKTVPVTFLFTFNSATVFHDRPPMRFKPTDLDQKHKVFLCGRVQEPHGLFSVIIKYN